MSTTCPYGVARLSSSIIFQVCHNKIMALITKEQNEQINREVMHETRVAMEKNGIGLDLMYLLGRVKYLCEATKPIAATIIKKPGKSKAAQDADSTTTDFIEVPDNAAIAKGTDMALTLGGHYPPKEIKADVNHSGSIMQAVAAHFSGKESHGTPQDVVVKGKKR